jgi:DNA-binding Lrp family transcriptional regulator
VELLVTTDARQLRRELDALAWAVLEDIGLDAQLLDGCAVAATSVRRLAANLGASKDAVARALRRLRDRSLVTRSAAQRETGGTFAPATYVLAPRVVALFIVTEVRDHRVTPSPSPHRVRRPIPSSASSQASLFEAEVSS